MSQVLVLPYDVVNVVYNSEADVAGGSKIVLVDDNGQDVRKYVAATADAFVTALREHKGEWLCSR